MQGLGGGHERNKRLNQDLGAQCVTFQNPGAFHSSWEPGPRDTLSYYGPLQQIPGKTFSEGNSAEGNTFSSQKEDEQF